MASYSRIGLATALGVLWAIVVPPLFRPYLPYFFLWLPTAIAGLCLLLLVVGGFGVTRVWGRKTTATILAITSFAYLISYVVWTWGANTGTAMAIG
jgi:hypothetical protein